MKKLKNIYTLFFSLVITFFGCQENEYEFGQIVAPSNINVSVEIVGADENNPFGDGSGFVNFTTTADNSSSYVYYFNDIPETAPSGMTTKRFTKVGVNRYQITIKANGNGGVSSSKTLEVEVFSSFSDVEAESFLSSAPITQDSDGNDIIGVAAPVSKTWYIAKNQTGALGVGPSLAFDIQINGSPTQYYFPAFFAAPAGTANDCFTDDELTFTKNADGSLTYVLDNKGQTFFNGNAAHQTVVGGSGANGDECFDFDASAQSTVSLSPTSEDWSQVQDPAFTPRGTVLNFTNNGFMGYYVSSTTYEILEISETEMHVRTLDAADPNLVWYLKFTSVKPADNALNTAFTNLVWEDNFNTDGAPNAANWTYDLGAGGWGNGELQTYTNNAENVIVEGGSLKIKAKANGSSYTSARLKSEGLREFTYGRFEIRAKLPASQGTWPALWMLGANFSQVSWPASGEIDILEQRGDDKNTVFSTLHYPGNFGGGGPSQSKELTTSTTEFHNYSVEWSAAEIKFAIDNEVYHTLPNDATLPFNADFFFILNVAMGGTLGGTVDPAFTEDMMEIDYIKVFQ
ncbi:family 16 glycosylhydrolase [Polaribacter sp. IC073]|uniref:glycoside hydrolase family 16 protein n=1 Tax=Polaribacter sp. IC073 TaxID=2508540 RepID=UPI0011BF4CDA|nr:glycoside hydrolase family 16 protein [Polaribacter sp. IC073]TXD47232.1 glycoside hydrolase family 16 protein [Polaribacter sp. IC073]